MQQAQTENVASSVNELNRSLISSLWAAFQPAVEFRSATEVDGVVRNIGRQGGLQALIAGFAGSCQGDVTVRHLNGSSQTLQHYGFLVVPRARSSTPAAVLSGSEQVAGQPSNLEFGMLNDSFRSRLSGTPASHARSSLSYNTLWTSLLQDTEAETNARDGGLAAIVISISARTQNAIEVLRQLSGELVGSSASRRAGTLNRADLKPLHYYVLVHEEGVDQLADSTSIFGEMKRHFGLQCGMLRLSSLRIRGQEHLTRKPSDHNEELIEGQTGESCRKFSRELLVQSIVPFLESRISHLNERILNRSRGINKLITFSRRWGLSGIANRQDNLDSSDENDTAKASRQSSDETGDLTAILAESAFRLRDWRLCAQISEVTRSDERNNAQQALKDITTRELFALSVLFDPRVPYNVDEVSSAVESAIYTCLSSLPGPHRALRTCLFSFEALLFSRRYGALLEALSLVQRFLECAMIELPLASLLARRYTEIAAENWDLSTSLVCFKRRNLLWLNLCR